MRKLLKPKAKSSIPDKVIRKAVRTVKRERIKAKPKLVFKTESVHITDYISLEQFFLEVFNQDFNYFADQESDKGATITVNKPDRLSEGEIDTLVKFRATGELPTYSLRLLLEECCMRDLIPAGKYVVFGD